MPFDFEQTYARYSLCPVSLLSHVHQGTRLLHTMPQARLRRAMLVPHCRLPIAFAPSHSPAFLASPQPLCARPPPSGPEEE